MSRSYKFKNPDGLYFISFATVYWIDVFTRRQYKDLLVDNLNYCIENKGLELFAWCIMTNHVHLICRATEGHTLPDIMRDFKKHTAKALITAISENQQESRREWMLDRFAFSGKMNPNNQIYQFWRQDNRPIELWSEDVIQQKLDYLHQNPVVAGLVDEPHHYPYSSAIDYSGGKGRLLIIHL